MSKATCQIDSCTGLSVALGLCSTDYARYRRGKLPEYTPVRKNRQYTYRTRQASIGPCQGPQCDRPARAEDLCDTHAEQRRRGSALTPIRISAQERGCKEDACPRPHEAHGYCSTHYAYAVGRAEIAVRSDRAPARNADGYVRVFVPGNPNAQKTGYALEHVVTMAAVIGRPILSDETVHHRNGVRDDNRAENLELWVSRHPKGQRVEDVVAWAKEILGRYESDALA